MARVGYRPPFGIKCYNRIHPLSIHEKHSHFAIIHNYVPMDKHISHLQNLIPTPIVPQAFAWIKVVGK